MFTFLTIIMTTPPTTPPLLPPQPQAARVDHDDESELELGLSLGSRVAVKSFAAAGKGSWSGGGRILTAKDFPSGISLLSSAVGNGNGKAHIFAAASPAAVYGSTSTKKRAAADSAAEQDNSTSPNGVSQVVGWPPIRTYRINSLTRESKIPSSEDDKDMGENEKFKETSKQKFGGDQNSTNAQGNGSLGFVKVNMDGLPIGRKIDLSAHACYETLAQTLEDMFFRSTQTAVSIQSGPDMELDKKTPKLLDGSSDFVLTYEDKEGDWMLVGDVPWGMFLNTVKRLRIMRTAEANGLSPRSHERQRTKPI